MARELYKRQVSLLLNILPEIAKEATFALHGGTAINLFVRNMPRLSVDIDLTYIPFDDRPTSLKNILEALERCKERIKKVVPSSTIHQNTDEFKIVINDKGVTVKVEVNTINRGILKAPMNMVLCEKAQNEFNVYCKIGTVPKEQLFGGKIVAALDRQHPRDLFDVKYILDNEGFSDEIKTGFLLLLICSERPIHEVLFPKLQDQRMAMDNQFTGMTDEEFTYEEYEHVRNKMIETIHKSLTEKDKQFLLSVKSLNPDWSTYKFQMFPAVLWKLQNLQKLKDSSEHKYMSMFEALKKNLFNLK